MVASHFTLFYCYCFSMGLFVFTQGLIQTTSPTQRYHSMDKAELNLAADLGETSGERVGPSGDTSAIRRKESSQLEATKHVIGSIVTFAMEQSYIATLVVMMV